MHFRWRSSSLCLTLGLSLFAATSPADAEPLPQDLSHWVTGGQNAQQCAWPAVALLGTYAPKTKEKAGCTGTLVHPQLVMYAAHCGTPYIMIFGEERKAPRVLKEADFAKIDRHPSWQNDSMTQVDWAYVRLKKPITDLPITPVVAGCEYDVLQKNGAPVIFAGFSKNNSTSQDAIRLRWANTTITSIGGGKIRAGGRGITACSGDSGGPMLAKLSDGSWRTVGIASTISNIKGCGQQGVWNHYAQIRRQLIQWVESSSGIDITPCFDLDGNPTPSPACDSFMAYADNPRSPRGRRANQCKEAPTVRAGDFCKVPKSDAGEDDSEDDEQSPDSNKPEESEDSNKPEESEDSNKPDESDESKSEDSDDESKTEDSDDESKTEDSEDESEDSDDESEDSDDESEDSDDSDNSKKSSDNPLENCSVQSGPTSPLKLLLAGFVLVLTRRRRTKRG